MFLKYFILVFLIFSSWPTFSSPVCEGGFDDPRRGLPSPRVSSSPRRRGTIGVESYGQLLVRLAQTSLGLKKISSEQIKALETYYRVVQGEEGTDGGFARAGNYTFPQRRRIVKYLREVFTPEQVTTLVEDGVVEINRSLDVKITNRVLTHLSKGKKIFIQLHSNVYKLNRVLEKTESGFLVEVEFVSLEGYTYTLHFFLVTRSDIKAPVVFVDPSRMTKISERTKSGFVIDVLIERKNESGEINIIEGNKVFFSFEKAWRAGLLPRRPRVKDRREIEDMLNTYIAENGNQQPAEKNPSYQMVDGTMMGNGKEYPNFEGLVKKSLTEGIYKYSLANPASEAIFVAVESNREKIRSRYLRLPPPTDTEAQLAEQGYKNSYKSGMDKVGEWVAVRKQLQKMKANPWKTHIEYFAVQIPIHIAHIRKGLEDNYYPREEFHGSKLEQLRRLEDLEKEAQQVTLEEKVTYEWWLEFNFRLAYIMSGFTANLKENSADIDSAKLNMLFFPIVIAMPDIQTEKGLGVIAFNKTALEGVYPVGLINQPFVNVHNEMSAYTFFSHDIFHSFFRGGNDIYREYSAGHRLFHKRLLDNIESLPPDKRKKTEMIYFLMTHEYQKRNISYSDRTLQEMREEVFRVIQTNDAGFFKPPSDLLKINSSVDTFMEVYNQTLQHQ